ncbi:hypothetical protein A2U01_0067037, partial [Trifolium medium]|nr:hypothetical protein [Trifolium medium]
VKGKRKKKTDTTKISIHIPHRCDSSVTGDGAQGAVQPSPKKRKAHEKVVSAIDAATVVSETISLPAPQKEKEVENTVAAISFWDPLFDPVEFIEKHLDLVGDSSRFSA